MRFRCDYFPFVEPGVEMAVDCFICRGAGCRLCKGTGWLEIMGAGMVHPKVLAGVGYDPERVQRLRLRHGPGADRHAQVRHRRHPAVLRQRPALLEAVCVSRGVREVNSMKVLLSWLREFVDVQLPAQELAHLLTMSGSEVASVEVVGTRLVRHQDRQSRQIWSRIPTRSGCTVARSISAARAPPWLPPPPTSERRQRARGAALDGHLRPGATTETRSTSVGSVPRGCSAPASSWESRPTATAST